MAQDELQERDRDKDGEHYANQNRIELRKQAFKSFKGSTDFEEGDLKFAEEESEAPQPSAEGKHGVHL